ncbi:MAG: Crp/Fnr family transcriptional regulator [Lewinella sp.]
MDLLSDETHLFRQAVRALSPFTNDDFAYMSAGIRCQKLGKRDLWIDAGQIPRTVGFVLSGALRYYHTIEGIEHTSYFSVEGEWAASYSSFLRQSPSQIAIQALEDTVLLTFSQEQLTAWENDDKFSYRINHFLRKLAEYTIACYDDRVAAFVLQSPEQRYRQLAEETEYLQRIPQQYIANYLGITPVSLSRIRKRLVS